MAEKIKLESIEHMQNIDTLGLDLNLTYDDAKLLVALKEAASEELDGKLRLGLGCNQWLIERYMHKEPHLYRS